ncbi:MAG TPA: phospho-N-acetylmuramoyl-pentapeptide-transferase [Armatimonadota bacterium]|nr:phospho-N-acetylmuramoyl-pentapeptide-transferase [Armatimonadota bacterium]
MHDPLALAAAFAVAVALGRPAIRLLRRWGCGQHVRDDGPQSHHTKQGTPTMGGVIIIIALVAGTVVSATVMRDVLLPGGTSAVAIVVGLAVGFGLIGLADDRAIIKHQRSLGLRAREKLVLQFALAAGFLYLISQLGFANLVVRMPFSQRPLALGGWYYPLAAVFIVGTSNSVNLTDGLDGLAAGLAAMAGIAIAALATVNGYPAVSAMCYALAGACVGFLWYNAHPARIFMGDTGALALGAALAGAAIMCKVEPWLLVIGVIFYLEALSVVIQVVHFRLTGRRILRMSPLHHHLELGGWPEPLIVSRMWILAGLIGWGAVLAERLLPL